MSYSSWPFNCPSSLQETPNPSIIRSALDDGYPKVRRRFTKTWRVFQASWRLMWTDYAAFWSFHEVDCGAGSIPFYVTHPITQEVILVRWKEPPQAQAGVDDKPAYTVTGTLEEVFS